MQTKKNCFFSKKLLEAADMRIVWKHGVPFRPFSISLFVLATVVIGGFSYVYWDDSLIWWEGRCSKPRTPHPPLTSAWGAPFSCPSPYLASLMEQSPWSSVFTIILLFTRMHYIYSAAMTGSTTWAWGLPHPGVRCSSRVNHPGNPHHRLSENVSDV